MRIGRFEGESESGYRDGRRQVVKKRLELWYGRKSFGHLVPNFVEAQHGMCGDRTKDPAEKGCGCWLYALPAGAVHLDHSKPACQGGGAAGTNLQAL